MLTYIPDISHFSELYKRRSPTATAISGVTVSDVIKKIDVKLDKFSLQFQRALKY